MLQINTVKNGLFFVLELLGKVLFHKMDKVGVEAKSFLEPTENKTCIVKATKKRWFILVIFMYYACANAFQWIEYCSITPIVVKYYNVSTLAVDWTSIVFMALYPFLIVPASYVTNKKVIFF